MDVFRSEISCHSIYFLMKNTQSTFLSQPRGQPCHNSPLWGDVRTWRPTSVCSCPYHSVDLLIKSSLQTLNPLKFSASFNLLPWPGNPLMFRFWFGLALPYGAAYLPMLDSLPPPPRLVRAEGVGGSGSPTTAPQLLPKRKSQNQAPSMDQLLLIPKRSFPRVVRSWNPYKLCTAWLRTPHLLHSNVAAPRAKFAPNIGGGGILIRSVMRLQWQWQASKANSNTTGVTGPQIWSPWQPDKEPWLIEVEVEREASPPERVVPPIPDLPVVCNQGGGQS